MKNILVTGSAGQLGSSLKLVSKKYNYVLFFKSKADLDITNLQILCNFIKKNKINTIVNCAAYTDVDKAETNKLKANIINNHAVENLAKLSQSLKLQLIHISTDYVFDGQKKIPYDEYDNTNPINYYGETKLQAENNIMKYRLENSAIIRTSWLYSFSDNNFVKKIINNSKNKDKIKVVDDEIGSPTNAMDLAEAIFEIIPKLKNKKTELFHYSNNGSCSRYEFAKTIVKFNRTKIKVIPIKKTKNKISRPKYSALDSSKILNKFQLRKINWEESLHRYLENIKY